MTEEYDEKPKKKGTLWKIAAIVIVIIALFVGFNFIFLNKKVNTNGAAAPSGQKFADSSLSQFAYQIFPGPMSDSTKQATSGFSIQTTLLPDGST